MPQKPLAAINISMHPNSQELYSDLVKDAAKNRIVKQARGTDYLMIAYVSNTTDANTSAVSGEIYKFTQIDPQGDWLNLEAGEVIEYKEGEEPPVPENLKPNLKRIPFVFFLDSHIFVFARENISPGQLAKTLRKIFNSSELEDTYGLVDVNEITSREGLGQMLAIPIKRKLFLDVSLPNPDDVSDEQEKILERYRQQKIRREKREQTAQKDESLEPDDETKALLELSLRNGSATIRGRNNSGTTVELSTKDHPLVENFDMADGVSPLQFVRSQAARLVSMIRNNGTSE